MYRLDIFLKSPRKVQELMWADLVANNKKGDEIVSSYELHAYDSCESPIEIIFYYFFHRVAKHNYEEDELGYIYKDGDMYGYEVIPQAKIKVGGNEYRVDFLIELHGSDDSNCPEGVPPDEIYSKVIVECDGHDFHEKTKEQVKRRNERDYNLQMGGYDLIHFSGSEIFNEPEECAKKVIEYLIAHLKPWEE